MKKLTYAKILVRHDRICVTYVFADMTVKFAKNRSSDSVRIADNGSYNIYKNAIDTIAKFFIRYKLKDGETYGTFFNKFHEVANSSSNPEIFLMNLKNQFNF